MIMVRKEGNSRGLLVEIHDSHAVNRGFESQKRSMVIERASNLGSLPALQQGLPIVDQEANTMTPGRKQ